jgi:hypothetical protein
MIVRLVKKGQKIRFRPTAELQLPVSALVSCKHPVDRAFSAGAVQRLPAPSRPPAVALA